MRVLTTSSHAILVMGPCGAGKTTYAQATYPDYAQPDREWLLRALSPDRQIHYYPAWNAVTTRLHREIVVLLAERGMNMVITLGGATQKERAIWCDILRSNFYHVSGVLLRVRPETTLARALADPARPTTSRSKWKVITDHWYRDWEPVASDEFEGYEEIDYD